MSGGMDPFGAVVDAFEALRDTILGVRNASKEEKRRWFTEHVEPLNLMMRKIYDDYAEGFDQAADGLRSGNDLQSTVDLLWQLRKKMVQERAEAPGVSAELARAKRRRTLGKGLGEDFYALAEAVSHFLSAGVPEIHLSFYKTVIENITSIQQSGADIDSPEVYGITYSGSPRERAAKVLDLCVQDLLPKAWSEFAAAYKRVSVQCT